MTTDVLPAERVDNQGGCEKEKDRCNTDLTNDLPKVVSKVRLISPSQEPLPEQLMKEAKTDGEVVDLFRISVHEKEIKAFRHGYVAVHEKKKWLPVSAVTEWLNKLTMPEDLGRGIFVTKVKDIRGTYWLAEKLNRYNNRIPVAEVRFIENCIDGKKSLEVLKLVLGVKP